MAQGNAKVYGFGLSREAHIAFAAAYMAALVTVAAFGALRLYAELPQLRGLHWPQFNHTASPIAFRARPMPDPAFPHRVNFYPRVALLNRQEGTVVVRLLVLKTGEVGDVRVVKSSGYPQLDAAALVGVGDWRYLPAIRGGVPISAEVNVAIHFKLA